jgi:hypothetical protein
MKGAASDGSDNGRKSAAEQIAREASRLARMANANGFGLLAYLIDMAVLEAWREASGQGSGDGASLHIDADDGGAST